MKKKLSKSQLKKQRKKIKPSNNTENKLLTAFKRVFNFKPEDTVTLDELATQAENFDYTKVFSYVKKVSLEMLKRNNEGFTNIISTLIQGSKGFSTSNQIKLNNALKKTINSKNIYEPLLEKFRYNVSLIKDVPVDIVNSLRNKYAQGVSFRGSDIEPYLEERLGKRAKLIIRTESAKLNSALTEMRAKNLGLVAFVWSTSEDSRVRLSHKMMDGVLVFYSTRLSLDKMIGFAGEFPNCRCIGIPVVTLEDLKFPIKVAIGNLSIETRKNQAVITSGKIQTFTKSQFLKQYRHLFNENVG